MNAKVMRRIGLMVLILPLGACVYIDKKSTPSIYNLDTVMPKAMAGDVTARENVGNNFIGLYPWGGIGSDPMIGFRYLQEAAESGKPGAQVALGNLYRTGSPARPESTQPVLKADLEKADYWLQRAAGQHHYLAYQGLTQIYSNPNFSAYSLMEACKWSLIGNNQAAAVCISPNLSPEQLEEARDRAKRWLDAHPVRKP